MLQADAIEAIAALARKASTPVLVADKNLPGQVGVYANGTFKFEPRGPADVSGHLRDFDSVVAFAKEHPEGEIRIDEERLMIYVDRKDRWQGCIVKLDRSARFEALKRLGDNPLQPRQAVQTLRFELEHNGPVTERLRRVSFTRKGTGHQHTEHGKESLGQAVEAEIQGHDSLPEFFDYPINPFTNPGFNQFTAVVRVGVWVDLDPAAPHILLVPSPDGLTAALHSAVFQAIGNLRGALPDTYPIYHGGI